MNDSKKNLIEFTSTSAPVQAEGYINGLPFYFRARWREWTFAVAYRAGDDPVLISNSNEGFFRAGTFGSGPADASYMPIEDAEKILASCILEYKNTL